MQDQPGIARRDHARMTNFLDVIATVARFRQNITWVN